MENGVFGKEASNRDTQRHTRLGQETLWFSVYIYTGKAKKAVGRGGGGVGVVWRGCGGLLGMWPSKKRLARHI